MMRRMNPRWKRFSALVGAMLLVHFSACSDDDSSPGADASVDSLVSRDGGDCSRVTDPCGREGVGRCENGSAWTCTRDAQGCLAWTVSQNCGEHETCVEQVGGATCQCENACAREGATHCEGTVIETCTKDDAGCLYLEQTEDCADATPTKTCVEETQGQASCAADCSESCSPGESRCLGFLLQDCQQADPCPVWQTRQDCTETNEYCEDRGDEPVCNSCEPPAEGCRQGDRCTMTTAHVFACYPAGPQGAGEDCSQQDCQAGLICMQLDSGPYTCQPYCQSSDDCPGDETHCIWPWADSTDVWGFCRDGCDPVTQTGCGQDQACIYMDPDLGTTDCWAAGTLQEGDTCSVTDLCAPGLDCIVQEGTNPLEYHCRRYCDATHTCPQGYTCSQTEASGLFKMCFPN